MSNINKIFFEKFAGKKYKTIFGCVHTFVEYDEGCDDDFSDSIKVECVANNVKDPFPYSLSLEFFNLNTLEYASIDFLWLRENEPEMYNFFTVLLLGSQI